ncbi:MAG: hypothetical protein NTW87_00070 [Planctomycetota bacterium]|nr:hypothetical protein [Planctomycetota bacterium]
MAIQRVVLHMAVALVGLILLTGLCFAQAEGVLPPGVKAVWDPAKAYRETTPTRERVCLNGLWRWQPAKKGTTAPPQDEWGYFKVPGSWPGCGDYMQKDCQTLYVHPSWKAANLGAVTMAWYQREITVPAEWAGRRGALSAEYLNSIAEVFVDGRKVGDLRFPAGETELTAACRPGERHMLSMLVTAVPLNAVMLSYSDTNATREVKGSVRHRGLCGDDAVSGNGAKSALPRNRHRILEGAASPRDIAG